ncbi:MAG: AEC family transporter [Eubacterium sp.]|nr:AEC family transporter [Eubacterium sp.]
MENLLFSLNVTMPVFLLMLAGMFFRKKGFISETFANNLNSFVFKIALPVNLFLQISTVDFLAAWDGRFVLFCFFGTLLCILISALFALLIKDRSERGEFIQASYRSSASLLGVAYLENIYTSTPMGALMMLGSVPLYNAAAVFILESTRSDRSNSAYKSKSAMIRHIRFGVITNPIILGILIGFTWSLLRLPMPTILNTTCSYIGRTASPLGLIAMGAQIDFNKAKGRLLPSVSASFLKLVGFSALLIALAYKLGFRDQELVAILIMSGSATTVASYIMARNMGHEGTLTSTTVLITSLFSAFTLTAWLFLFKTLGLL